MLWWSLVDDCLSFCKSLGCCCRRACSYPQMASRDLADSGRAANCAGRRGLPSRQLSGEQRANGTQSSAASHRQTRKVAFADASDAAFARAADFPEPAAVKTYHVRGMNDEAVRLKTFLNSWSTQHRLQPAELARDGFFRKGSGAVDDDWVQCAFCNLLIQSKSLGNRLRDQHLMSASHCPLARGERTSNMTAPPAVAGCRQQIDPHRTPHSMQRPQFPAYECESNRRHSFANWQPEPPSSKLAAAGFFYTGPGDMVKCFSCGQSLNNWQPTDDPFVEHARWSKECPFLLDSKGYDFVVAVHVAVADMYGPRGEVHPVSEVLAAQMLPGDRRRAYDVTGIERVPAEHLPTQHGVGTHCNAPATSATVAHHAPFGNPVALGGLPEVIGSGHNNTSTGATLSTLPQPPARSQDESANAEQLRDRLTCKICMDRQVCVTFRPCGHLCVCQECSASVSVCPMCRGRIRERQLTFLS